MSPKQFVEARNRYAYSLVGLSERGHEVFQSSQGLESFHYKLLSSDKAPEVLQGYLSTIYWGWYSGRDQNPNPNFAMSKVTSARAKLGSNETQQACVSILRSAHSLLRKRHFGPAVLLLTNLPQIRFSFATKLCSFFEPQSCGVADRLIAEYRPNFGFLIDNKGYVTSAIENAFRYQAYCAALSAEASAMNALGERYRWTDRDNVSHEWRAVDIERAYFQFGPAR